MGNELTALIVTAASIGFLHTLLGPDHYLPFVAISKARNWTAGKTTLLTIICGFGHVLGSVVLGIVGVALGTVVSKLEAFESFRGELAAWLLIAFGIAYLSWGLRRALRKEQHTHHIQHKGKNSNITPWVIFIIFVLGPCEPLIPILMYPAAKSSFSGMLIVTAVFALTTITTMTVIVRLLMKGIDLLPLHNLERFSHALAGFIVLMCGVAIQCGL